MFEPIKETAYLSAQKSFIYRNIMRIFFQEYEKMRYQLYKEDIYTLLKRMPNFEEYTMDNLKGDLEVLTEWRNLTAMQDFSKKARSIEEFKNKNFRYSMTERAIAIERMTVALENIHYESKILTASSILRIKKSLEEIKENKNRKMDSKEINEWWKHLQDNFKKLNESYQDYLGEFYNHRTENLMKTMEFLSYKDRFISILKEFIRELQINSSKMEQSIKEIQEYVESEVLAQIIESEIKNKELLLNENIVIDEKYKEAISEKIVGQWESLKRWFISTENWKSEYRNILDVTTEIIGKIIQNAFLITQKRNWRVNKKEHYKKIMQLFIDCENIDEAHKLSAHIFGIQNIRHYKADDLITEDSNISVYDENDESEKRNSYTEYILESHNKVYKPKVEKTGFEDRTLLRLRERAKYREKLEENKKTIIKHIKDGMLDISAIDEVVTEEFRKFILKMITLAEMSVDKRGRTEYGQGYEAVRTDKRFTLKCEDGDLEMPVYIFKFLEE